MFFLSLLTISTALPLIANAQSCPPLPSTITYPSNAKLPDPFLLLNSTRVTTAASWECRRTEISSLIQRLELGELPVPPKSSISTTYSSNRLTITIKAPAGSTSISFAATIRPPTSSSAPKPWPAIIALGSLSIPQPPNVAVVTYNNEELAPTLPRGAGKFFTLYGTGQATGGLQVWAWGVHRIIDALEQTPAAGIDPTRVAVTGCSRNGKAALIAGAFDRRIALTIPQEGGSGGPGCWRLADDMKRAGTNVETAAQIVTGDQWFLTAFEGWVQRVPELPYDHHLLAAMVAPRGLLVVENSGIDYLGPVSTYGCMLAAKEVYKALGVGDRLGFSQVAHGTSHCQFPGGQQQELTAFVNRFLLGQTTAGTEVFKTDKNYNWDRSKWIDWATPTLT